jgi:hypothetical protein
MRRALFLLIATALAAQAHNGPPFGIIVDKKIGVDTVNVWANPDIGVGTFFVFVDPPNGRKVPDDLRVEIAAQPTSKRIPEVRFGAQRQAKSGQVEFDASHPFDRREFWRFRVILSSAEFNGESEATVEVTPVGLGRWDLLWFALPFLAVGFLWFKALQKKRRRIG